MERLRFTTIERVSGKLRHNIAELGYDQIRATMLDTHDPEQMDALQRLRHENEVNGHSEEYKRIKQQELKAWTPAGILVSGKGTSRITEYSGIVQVDIDEQDNANLGADDLKSLLPSLIPSCVYICRSCGGNGIFALIRTTANDEATYRATARAIIAALAVNGIIADPTTDEPTRLRFVTMDADPYENAAAPVLSLPSKVMAYFTNGIKTTKKETATTGAATTAKSRAPMTSPTMRANNAPSLPLPKVRLKLPTAARQRFAKALKAIAADRVDIAPSDEEYITLIVSLKSAVVRHVMDDADGLAILLFLSQFWTNTKGEAWTTTETNARRKWSVITGVAFGAPVAALNGFYFLCHRYGLKQA